jgi:hypothetical protein
LGKRVIEKTLGTTWDAGVVCLKKIWVEITASEAVQPDKELKNLARWRGV